MGRKKDFIRHWQENKIRVEDIPGISVKDFNQIVYELEEFVEGEKPLVDFSSSHALTYFKTKKGLSLVLNQDKDDPFYNFPGGHQEGQESEVETLVR